MPAQNLTHQQQQVRDSFDGTSIADASAELAAVIAAGPYHSADPLHMLAYDAAQLHARAHDAASARPHLRAIARVLGDVAHDLNAAAERAGL